jgi:hypothetical protein
MGIHMEVPKATKVKITNHSNKSYIVTEFCVCVCVYIYIYIYTSAVTWFCIPISMQPKPQQINADGVSGLNMSTFNTMLLTSEYSKRAL